MDDKEKQALVDRVLDGETMQSVALDLGISRERVRQIALEFGVTGASVRILRRNRQIEVDAPEIITLRGHWVPPRFVKRPYTQSQFEEHLKVSDPGLYAEWIEADQLPLSKSGHADPHGQRCSDCHQWQGWDRFYSDKSRRYGKSSRCVDCAKKNADETRRKRNVVDATVSRKRCRRCERRLVASRFSRSTTSPTGLQQYCKDCQREYERDRRSKT
jgi:Sigma-70, region 4.